MDRLTEDHFSFKCPMRWEDMAVSLSAAACQSGDQIRTTGTPLAPGHKAYKQPSPIVAGEIKPIQDTEEVVVPGRIAPIEPKGQPANNP